MFKNIISCVLTITVVLVGTSFSTFAEESNVECSEYDELIEKINSITVYDEEITNLEEIKIVINSDIESQNLTLDEEWEEYDEKESSELSDKIVTEYTVVNIDLRESMEAVKYSLDEPITVYDETVTKIYTENENLNSSSELQQVASVSDKVYATTTRTVSRTYNGVTTTVRFYLYYYLISATIESGNTFDVEGASIYKYRTTFSAASGAHVTQAKWLRTERGINILNNWRVVCYNLVNSYSFSMNASSGSKTYSNSNYLYEKNYIVITSGTGQGTVGVRFYVLFTWSIGGSGYMQSSVNIPICLGGDLNDF